MFIYTYRKTINMKIYSLISEVYNIIHGEPILTAWNSNKASEFKLYILLEIQRPWRGQSRMKVTKPQIQKYIKKGNSHLFKEEGLVGSQVCLALPLWLQLPRERKM